MTQESELHQEVVEGEEGETPETTTEKELVVLEVLEAELEETRRALGEEQERVQVLEAELAGALSHYRDALLAGTPDIPPELIQGETVAALEEAFTRAKALVERVQRRVEAQAVQGRVPAGAPPRTGPNLSGLSSQEKIRLGLRQIQG